MPFQALPIAFRANTACPLAKLVYIWLVKEADIHDTPSGQGFVEGDPYELTAFAQCTIDELKGALATLKKLRLVTVANLYEDEHRLIVDVSLPMSDLKLDERKRIKCGPDQIVRLVQLAGYRCATCGETNYSDEGWHVDHIIPRSRGGADTEENCQALCATCNSKKGAKLHWVGYL